MMDIIEIFYLDNMLPSLIPDIFDAILKLYNACEESKQYWFKKTRSLSSSTRHRYMEGPEKESMQAKTPVGVSINIPAKSIN